MTLDKKRAMFPTGKSYQTRIEFLATFRGGEKKRLVKVVTTTKPFSDWRQADYAKLESYLKGCTSSPLGVDISIIGMEEAGEG